MLEKEKEACAWVEERHGKRDIDVGDSLVRTGTSLQGSGAGEMGKIKKWLNK